MDPATREWLDEKFAALTQRLVAQDRTLERVERQTTLTNGRVGKLEERVAGIAPRLDNHDRELREMKRNAPSGAPGGVPEEALVGRLEGLLKRAETGQERNVKIWMVSGVVAVIIATVVFLNFFGFIKKPGEVVIPAPAAVVR